MKEEKVTVQIAAKALKVTPKTIHQWFRNGTLSKIKEGNRTYVLIDEIRTLREKKVITKKDEVITFDGNQTPGNNQGNNIVPIDRNHYEGLLTRLGQLEAEKRHLLEYKEGIEKKDKVIVEQQVTIEQKNKELEEAEKILQDRRETMELAGQEINRLRKELARLRRPWWKKIFQ